MKFSLDWFFYFNKKKILSFFFFFVIITLNFGGFFMKEYYTIAKEIQKLGVQKVAHRRNCTVNELIAILDRVSSDGKVSKSERNDFRNLLEQIRFLLYLNAKKMAILSDTHIGHEKANFDYIKRAYDYFDKLGIQVVFHVGDLFEGFEHFNLKHKKRCKSECIKQLNLFSENYPKGFQNYIVLGNHEVQFLNLGIDLVQEIPEYHENFTVLGYGRAYVKCQSYKISFSHSVSKKILVPYYRSDCDLNLFGHSHFYFYNEELSSIKIPTCSNNQMYGFYGEEGKPGFIVLNFEEDFIESQRFMILDHEIKPFDNIRIRKK